MWARSRSAPAHRVRAADGGSRDRRRCCLEPQPAGLHGRSLRQLVQGHLRLSNGFPFRKGDLMRVVEWNSSASSGPSPVRCTTSLTAPGWLPERRRVPAGDGPRGGRGPDPPAPHPGPPHDGHRAAARREHPGLRNKSITHGRYRGYRIRYGVCITCGRYEGPGATPPRRTAAGRRACRPIATNASGKAPGQLSFARTVPELASGRAAPAISMRRQLYRE